LIADIFNKPVKLKQGSDSVAVGAYLLSATQLGIYKNLEQAAQTIELPDKYTPKKQHHNLYMKHYAIFERLSTKLFDEFEAIANLQQKEQ
jgi:gluconokinase